MDSFCLRTIGSPKTIYWINCLQSTIKESLFQLLRVIKKDLACNYQLYQEADFSLQLIVPL